MFMRLNRKCPHQVPSADSREAPAYAGEALPTTRDRAVDRSIPETRRGERAWRVRIPITHPATNRGLRPRLRWEADSFTSLLAFGSTRLASARCDRGRIHSGAWSLFSGTMLEVPANNTEPDPTDDDRDPDTDDADRQRQPSEESDRDGETAH